MASLMGSLRAPQCMSCVRRVNSSFNDAWLASTKQQIRGKKKLAKLSTINVRLLRDVTRYGKEGSVIPLPSGRMRNQFFPRRMAEYMTQAQMKEAGLEGTTVERDYTFGIKASESAKKASEPETAVPGSTIAVDLDLLKHDKATATIAKLLPENIDFHRTPIAAPAPPQRRSPSLPATSVLSEAAGGNQPKDAETKKVYGSVSTSDIASSIKAILTEDNDGSRILLGPEDITFAVETEDKDRVKHLGTFEVDIRVKGAPNAVRRTITVKAQE